MALYIILAIIIIALIIVGIMFYLRSSKRQVVEKTEERKIEVEKLTLDDRLRELDDLTLEGETQLEYDRLKRESLKNTNDNLSPVEEKIHNAEENFDKFKFAAAQAELDDANALMDRYESQHAKLTEEVENILALHKESDRLFEESKVAYREMKRDVLANRHQFGEAAAPLEKEIELFEPELVKYTELKEEGNYKQAYEHIKTLNEDINYLQKDMQEIPELIREAQKELPGQFQDLKYGCRDLKVEGYDLDHVKVDSNLQSMKTELSFVEPMISRLELEEANDKLNAINDQLDEMYDLIEHEVKSKNKVDETKEVITNDLFRAKDTNYTLQTEIEYVRENYYINETDIQNVRQFENEIQNLISVYDEILREMSKSTVRYSEVQDLSLIHI